MTFKNPQTLGRDKWYIPVSLDNGNTHYLHLDGEVKDLRDAGDMLFPTKEAALEAKENYNKVIRIGGE